MGIFCEINLHKPLNGEFVGTAGNVVSGTIKYAVDEETTFTKITVSLKGLGVVHTEQTYMTFTGVHYQRISKKETYIDIDNVIQNEQKINITPVGQYTIPFRFEIPKNVPPSVKYDKDGRQCRLICAIKYYVRIKFNRLGAVNFTKRFKKDITMVSGIMPRLPTIPTIYGGNKNMTQLFACNSSHVNIKAYIMNSIFKCGDKIDFNYELTNNTKLVINGVETKLIEAHKLFMKPGKVFAKEYEDIPGTESKTPTVKRGETQEMQTEIVIPDTVLGSAEFSKIYSREYFVCIKVYLPLPHKNYELKIPVQIDKTMKKNYAELEGGKNDSPPSYWESMNEYKDDKIDVDEKEIPDNMMK